MGQTLAKKYTRLTDELMKLEKQDHLRKDIILAQRLDIRQILGIKETLTDKYTTTFNSVYGSWKKHYNKLVRFCRHSTVRKGASERRQEQYELMIEVEEGMRKLTSVSKHFIDMLVRKRADLQQVLASFDYRSCPANLHPFLH